MSMIEFRHLYPEVAREESLAITPVGGSGLPERPLLFLESYCAEARCDCRRVLLSVVDAERREQVATLNYSFEPPVGRDEDLGQLFLDPINPQSEFSDLLREFLEHHLAFDPTYRERLMRHYTMWKAVIGDPTHPDRHKVSVRSGALGYGIFPPRAARRAPAGVGRNEPCPCGSGKKYKRCCA